MNFPIPPENIEFLRLELPLSAFGGAKEQFRLQIPKKVIENFYLKRPGTNQTSK